MIHLEQNRANCEEINDSFFSWVPATSWNTIKLSALLILYRRHGGICAKAGAISLSVRCSAPGDEHAQKNNCHQSESHTLTDVSTTADAHVSLSPSPLPPSYALQGRIWLSLQKSVKKKKLLKFKKKKKKEASKEWGFAASEISFYGSCAWSSYDIRAWWLIVGRKSCIILSQAAFIAWGRFSSHGCHFLWRLQASTSHAWLNSKCQ